MTMAPPLQGTCKRCRGALLPEPEDPREMFCLACGNREYGDAEILPQLGEPVAGPRKSGLARRPHRKREPSRD